MPLSVFVPPHLRRFLPTFRITGELVKLTCLTYWRDIQRVAFLGRSFCNWLVSENEGVRLGSCCGTFAFDCLQNILKLNVQVDIGKQGQCTTFASTPMVGLFNSEGDGRTLQARSCSQLLRQKMSSHSFPELSPSSA